MSTIIPTGIIFYDNENFNIIFFFLKTLTYIFPFNPKLVHFIAFVFFQRATFALTLLMQNGEITDNHEFLNKLL